MSRSLRSSLLLALLLTLVVAASARAVTAGDAYATQGANACTWTIGTAAVEKVLTFSSVSGTYALTSFENKLTSPAREYVDAGTPSSELRFTWDGTELTGATPGWSCVSGSAAHTTAGGASAMQLDVTLARTGLHVTKHYLVYPSTSVIREWADYENTDTSPHTLARPSFLEQHVMGDETADSTLQWMSGARAVDRSWQLRSTPLSTSYARTFDSYDSFDCPTTTSGVGGWQDIGTYSASGYLGMPEWHDTGGFVWPGAEHPGPSNDTARVWTAPSDGTVDITSHVAKMNTSGNGVVVSITQNGSTIWSKHTIAGTDTAGIDANLADVAVHAGDAIRFVIGNNGDWANDATSWDPSIAYQGAGGASFTASTGFSSTQGANGWSYQDLVGASGCPTGGWTETSSVYIPWFSIWNRTQKDGVAVGFDYYGRWAMAAGDQGGGRGSLSLSIPNYDQSLAPNDTVTTPQAFTAVYVNDSDDMTNRLLDWQYRYMWDYTRSPYFGAIRMLGYWYNGSQWTGAWDQAGTLQKVFGLADHLRTMGADTYHRDNGWWDTPGNWNGPDFRSSGDYLAQSGIKQLVYMMAYDANTSSDVYAAHPDWFATASPCGYADRLIDLTKPGAETWMGDLLIGKAQSWGDFQWRNDSCPVADWSGARQLAQDQAFRRVQQRFLDTRPGSALQAVDSGGNEVSWEFMRMASGFSITDRDGAGEQYDASRLFPADKMSGIPDAWNPGSCSTAWNELLMFNPDFTGDTSDTTKLTCMRKLVDLYHYMLEQDVAGRWVHQFHPHASDEDRNWFERVSKHQQQALVIYKGGAGSGSVTVYPKGLDPSRTYDVRYQLASGSASRTGADLMGNGVTLTAIQAGELIWIGMPKHPGSGQDTTAPTAPSNVTAQVRTNMGYAGTEVTWDAGSDDNHVSGYEVDRGGTEIAFVAKGRSYFDHSHLNSPNAPYSVKTVDGDGNRSAAADSAGFTADTLGVDDGDPAVTYSGPWSHKTTGVPDASGGTVSTFQDCHDACQGFSSTQGANGWRYQDLVSGAWHDIATYSPSGYLGMREWHDPTGGFVWPGAEHPGSGNDTARTWVAPKDGTVDIASHVAKLNTQGDGVIVKITKNGATIWGPTTIAGSDTAGVDANVANVGVAAGDAIRFEINRNGDYTSDATAWDPWITYHGDPPPSTTTPTASFTFTGGSITWLAKLGPDEGKATVKIDGATDATIDLYAPDDDNWSVPVYGKTFPTVGTHTVEIVQSGQRNSRSSGIGISVDGFQALTNAATVTEDGDSAIAYDGSGWSTSSIASASGGAAHVSAHAGDSATVTFTGRRITWVGRLCPACGKADVSLDGTFAARIDTYGFRGPDVTQAALYQATFPTSGPHTLTVKVLGDRNYDATGSTVQVDAFHVRP
jgi:hypothetical protein